VDILLYNATNGQLIKVKVVPLSFTLSFPALSGLASRPAAGASDEPVLCAAPLGGYTVAIET